MARQRLGQHFLADADWREQIAQAIRVSPNSISPNAPETSAAEYCWIEIGSGHGEMTAHLVTTGAPVYAIEIDKPFIDGLRHLGKKNRNLTVIAGDVLQANITQIAAGRRAKIYGNLPYYITSPILHHLFGYAEAIDEIHIVIQTEVAQRLAAEPGNKEYGYLSVITQLYTRPELVFEIPKSAFDPPPEVTSALVTLRLPGERAQLALPGDGTAAENEEKFLDFVKICFSQKRKTLVNNLRSLGEPEMVRGKLEKLGVRLDARAEQLSVRELAGLYGELRVR